MFKICKSCREITPHEEFRFSENSEDGAFPFCEKCIQGLKDNHDSNFKRYFGGKK